MNIQKKLSLMLVWSLLALFLSAAITASTALETDPNNASSRELISTQDFVEMLPGVFVSYSWYNYTESYTDVWTASYENVSTAIGSVEPVEPLEPGDETDPGKDVLLDPYLIEVDDTDGKSYDIRFEEQWEWSGSWNSTEFVVEVVVDADHSLVNGLSQSESIWDVSQDSYTGDEVYYSTNFYLFDWSYNYISQQKYTWIDEQKEIVNPNDIIPTLDAEYEWASNYNDSYRYEDVGHYSMFGFSVFQQTLLNNTNDSYTTFEIEHFFQGLSIFNDTNGNGIIDVSYDNYYALGEDAEIALSSDPTNNYKAGNSELVYDVWLSEATLEEIIVPHVVDNQIDWSVKLNNVYAELWSGDLWLGEPAISANDEMVIYEPNNLEIVIPQIEFKYHFLVKDNIAMLKIDQIVGDFLDIETGLIPKELEGLSLTINYWTSTFSYNEMVYDLELSDINSINEISTDESVYNSSELEAGLTFLLDVVADDFEFSLVDVEFEDIYTWTKDNEEYEVKIAIIPMWIFGSDIYHQAGIADDFGFEDSLVRLGGTYYYSSCYIQWSGYGIIHDPSYSALVGVDDSNTNNSTTAPISGFEILPLLIALPILTGVMKNQKKNKK